MNHDIQRQSVYQSGYRIALILLTLESIDPLVLNAAPVNELAIPHLHAIGA